MVKRLTAIPLVAALLLALNMTVAQAYSVTSCRFNGSHGVTVYECYYDYNWFETAFLAKKDGWYPQKMWW